jgi:signal peptidase II
LKHLRAYLMLVLVVGVVVGLDIYTKWLVMANLDLGEMWLPETLNWLLPYARIVHWYNTGAAFGIFQNGNPVFMVLAVIVMGIILYYFPKVESEGWWLQFAMSLQMSGALGNFIDRVRFGHVIDFLSVGTFPVFNVADSSITVGVIVLIIGVWWKESHTPKPALAEETSQAGETEAGSGE